MVFTCIRSCSEQKPLSIRLYKYNAFPLESIALKKPSKDKQIGCQILIHKFSTFPPQPQHLWLCCMYKIYLMADPFRYIIF